MASDDDYCDMSWLRKESCALPCCLDQYVDPEVLAMVQP